MDNKESTAIRVERVGEVAWVTIDRLPVNAITLADYQRITDVFAEISGSPDVMCVVLTGAGERAFCAGLDRHEFMASTPEEDPARALIVRNTFEAIRTCAVPVIAAVNGPALGAGAALASSADIRIASERATFGMPEINIGRCGGASHLGRHIPQGLLRKMFFTGEPIDAHEGYRVGLVDEVVKSSAELHAAAERLAAIIASKSRTGLTYGKASLNEVEGLRVEVGYPIEQAYSTRLMGTPDAREAVTAVIEKRAPVWGN